VTILKTIKVTNINSAIQTLSWPINNVLAIQTSRYPSSVVGNDAFKTSVIPCYDYFNLGLHVGDSKPVVLANRQQLLKQLTANNIQWLNQVHGSNVVTISSHSSLAIEADASVTRCKNLALAIMTADCLPILLSNKEGTEIAAIHGGWRPLAANIIDKTLANMHSKTNQLVAWLGPCIGFAHFEVGVEVKRAFVEIDAKLGCYFEQNKSGQFQADLAGIAVFLLQKSGVTLITHCNECTVSQQTKYYSFRRDNQTGRMASLIVLQ
jgi:hypothetical protein